jgi:tRNA pseudouridine55 synthase
MGLALVWKKAGISSQDALYKFKKEYALNHLPGRQGIGHSGTLDPFAEGWLLVAWNEGLKLLPAFMNSAKTYEVTMIFGVDSTSHDTENEMNFSQLPTVNKKIESIKTDFFAKFLEAKVGHFQQVPPQFSAVKINGQRAYDLARKGQQVEIAPRDAEIIKTKHLILEKVNFETHQVWQWRFDISVSSGTYIRSLARDWGQEISSSPAILRKLIRNRIDFLPMDCIPEESPYFFTLKDLEKIFQLRVLVPELSARLQKSGYFPRVEAPEKPELLLNNLGEILAWRHAKQEKIARVFRADPLSRNLESSKR